jgi:alpha-1,4-digalacturonate transport system substrate-binding protein
VRKRFPDVVIVAREVIAMRRRWYSLVGAAVCGAALLAGCAPGSGSDSGGGGSQSNHVSYVYFTDGPDEKVTKDLIKQFEQQHNAVVELQILPFSELEQQLQARIASGDAPDVARLHTLTGFRDALLDLRTVGQDIGGDFLKEAQEYIHNSDGSLVAVPSDLTMNGPFVNTDMFAKAGVPLPAKDKPWTWPELVANARKAQQAAGTEYAIAYDKSGHRVSGLFSQFGTNLYGAGGQVEFDQAKATEAVRLFVELNQQNAMSKDFWIESGTKYKGANDIFLRQDAPVYISGNWQVSQLIKAAEFGWAAIPNPCAQRCGGFPGGKFMSVFKDAENPELAAKFVAFMNSKASQEKFATEAGFLPTRTELIESGVDYPNRAEDMKIFLDDAKRTDPSGFASNYSPGFTPTATAIVKELAAAIAGQQSVEDTVNKIREAARKNLEAAGG